MSIKVRKIVTTLMATGMLLSTAAGSVSAKRVHHHGYRPRTERVTRRYTRKHAKRVYKKHARKPARKRTARITRKQTRKASRKPARVGRVKVAQRPNAGLKRTRKPTAWQQAKQAAKTAKSQDSFVMLKYQPTRNGERNLADVARALNRADVTYGVYVNNMGNVRANAKRAVQLTPGASFYADVQGYYTAGENWRAEAFAKTVRGLTNQPRVFYAGTRNASKGLKDAARNGFQFSWTSQTDHSGANVWAFKKGGSNDGVGQALKKDYFDNRMPVEFGVGAQYVYPLNDAEIAAMSDAQRGDFDDANRAMMAGAMQEYGHRYENDKNANKKVPSKPLNRLLKTKAKPAVSRKHSVQLGADKGTKGQSKNFGQYKQNAKNYMLNWKPYYHVNQGNTDGCEIASLKMAFNVLGLGNKTPRFEDMLKATPVNPNPERGYWRKPVAHSGAGIYPQALTKQANRWLKKAHKPQHAAILADNNFTGWFNHGREHYSNLKKGQFYDAGLNIGGRNVGKVRRQLTMDVVRNGHPVVYEGCHQMDLKHHARSDHVLVLWGIKGTGDNAQMFFSDPNTSSKAIHHVSAKQFFQIVNENDTKAARGPRAIVVSD